MAKRSLAKIWICAFSSASLALAAVGIGYSARLCAADWRDALANSTARFGMLRSPRLTLPAIALNSNLYDDWRQMYFLCAPLRVLAAFRLRAAVDGVVAQAARSALGIAAAVQMVSLHPLQSKYLNFLADKGGIAERREMNYRFASGKETLDAPLKIQPSGRIPVIADAHRRMAKASCGMRR